MRKFPSFPFLCSSCLIASTLLVSACQLPIPSGLRGDVTQEKPTGGITSAPLPASAEIPTHATKQVVVLAPVTGPSAPLGKAMEAAAKLALKDTGNNDIHVQVIDTATDFVPEWQKTITQTQPYAVLGPIFTKEMQQFLPVLQASPKRPLVMSFSNNPEFKQQGVYLFGFMIENQLLHILRYAKSKGIEEVSLLAPNNPLGTIAVDLVRTNAPTIGLSLLRTELYRTKEDLPFSIKALAATEKPTTTPAAKKRALLIVEGGSMLASIAQLLEQEPTLLANVQLLGSGLWDDPSTFGLKALQGAWFASGFSKERAAFEQHFKEATGYAPPRLASLAYDAMALTVAMSKTEPQPQFDSSYLRQAGGFAGIDGRFRLTDTGQIERDLHVFEVGIEGFTLRDAEGM